MKILNSLIVLLILNNSAICRSNPFEPTDTFLQIQEKMLSAPVKGFY